MSKIMSVFEKLNLIEKVNDETPNAVKTFEEDAFEGEELENAENYINESIVESSMQRKNVEEKNVQANSNYEKNMSVSEIYDLNGMESSDINTVFMLGNFINALPENLPYDVKKNTVMNIINASNTDLNNLLSDGEKRLFTLNQFAEDYSKSIANTVAECKMEIIKFTNFINSLKEQIQVKETMLEEQNNKIKYETQKINSIIDFFKNGD